MLDDVVEPSRLLRRGALGRMFLRWFDEISIFYHLSDLSTPHRRCQTSLSGKNLWWIERRKQVLSLCSCLITVCRLRCVGKYRFHYFGPRSFVVLGKGRGSFEVFRKSTWSGEKYGRSSVISLEEHSVWCLYEWSSGLMGRNRLLFSVL